MSKRMSHFGTGALAYSFEADRNKVRMYRGFLMEGQPTRFNITITSEKSVSIPLTDINISPRSRKGGLHKASSKAVDPSSFYGFPKQVPANLDSYSLCSMIVGCEISPNKKFRQDVGYSSLDYDYANKHPYSIMVEKEGWTNDDNNKESGSELIPDEVDDPYFYYWDKPRSAHFDIKNSVVLAENLVLISESGQLKICKHEDTDKLTRSVEADKLEIGTFERIPVKSTTKKKSYDYIKYCNNCERIIELI